jgi:ATP-dependent Lon protease
VGGGVETPVAIAIDTVRDALGRQRLPESAERTAVPGVATGLAAPGPAATSFVEATSAPSLVLTGQLRR